MGRRHDLCPGLLYQCHPGWDSSFHRRQCAHASAGLGECLGHATGWSWEHPRLSARLHGSTEVVRFLRRHSTESPLHARLTHPDPDRNDLMSQHRRARWTAHNTSRRPRQRSLRLHQRPPDLNPPPPAPNPSSLLGAILRLDRLVSLPVLHHHLHQRDLRFTALRRESAHDRRGDR